MVVKRTATVRKTPASERPAAATILKPAIEVFTFPQGSDEWHEARRGIPTASRFKTVMAGGVGGGDSKTRAQYMRMLAGEIITGKVCDEYKNDFLDRGHAMEPEARKAYAFAAQVDLEIVGFIRAGKKGCSPDALIGDDGMLEIKTTQPDKLIELLLRDEFPMVHKPQVQGGLWVADRKWCDLCVYWPGMRAFIKRMYRDEEYIATLSAAVDIFNLELKRLVQQVNDL